MDMSEPKTHRSCGARCTASVPQELDAVGLCVSHFTFNVEQACAEMHRQLAMRGMSPDRRAEITLYVGEHALMLARIASSLSLSDVLKRRVLSTFLSLMNLRETLERSAAGAPPVRITKAIAPTAATPATAVA
jgi:hypothetical protein